MQILVRADGVDRERHNLTGLADRLSDARPAFEGMIDDLRDRQRRHFGGDLGSLAPSTVARKARSDDPRVRGNAERPLIATGETMASVTSDASGALAIVRPGDLTFGTTIAQARFHQPDRQGRTVLDTDASELTGRMRAFLIQTYRGPA